MTHKGYLLLEGGAEFGGKMSEPDLRSMVSVSWSVAMLPSLGVSVCVMAAANCCCRADRTVSWVRAILFYWIKCCILNVIGLVLLLGQGNC